MIKQLVNFRSSQLISSANYSLIYRLQEYIIGREGEYPTGVMTLVMIFTNKVASQFVLLHHIAVVLVPYRPQSLATCP